MNTSVEELLVIDVQKEIKEFPLIPVEGRIFVIEDEVVKSHGLYVPDSSRKEGEMQTNTGYVVSIGGKSDFVKLGDRVIYARFSGAWVMDRKYRVMNEEDLLGKFK
jgi:co-chaperonin GroES (HSP10)